MQKIGDALGASLNLIGDEAPKGDGARDEEGLLRCPKCGERKEFKLPTGPFAGRIVNVTCQCERDAYEAEKARRANDEKLRRIAELRRASLMDARMRESIFERFTETPHNQKALRFCRYYVDAFDEMLAENQGILMLGPPGTGKTFLAACVANALIERQVPLIITSFIRLLGLGYGSEIQEMINRINEAALVIIDDLGAERETTFAQEQVYRVLDARYRTKRPMILTTNLTLTQIQSDPDIRLRRVYERIIQTCHPLEFTGPSWRNSEAARRYERMESMLRQPNS